MIDEYLQEVVNQIQEKRMWGVNDIKAKFIVSILINTNQGNKPQEQHKILLTIQHNGYCYSRIIFPKVNQFDYMSLEEEMQYLFNATV